MKQLIATEAQEQASLFTWADLQRGKYKELSLLYAIPNGGSRHPLEAKNLKAQGVKPGVPDICLPVPRCPYHALYIELKRTKGGVVSVDQKSWLDRLNKHGNLAVVCRGWEEAAEVITRYLEGKE